MNTKVNLRNLINFGSISKEQYNDICNALRDKSHLIFIGALGSGTTTLQAIIHEMIEETFNPTIQNLSFAQDNFFHTSDYLISEPKEIFIDFSNKESANFIVVDSSVDISLDQLPPENDKSYIICRRCGDDVTFDNAKQMLQKSLPPSTKPYFLMYSYRTDNGQRKVSTCEIIIA